MKFGERMKRVREEKNLTLEEMARVIGDCFADESTGRFVFHYSEIDSFENLDAINFMYDERSKKAFAEDKKWIDWSNCVLLVLPAGKSAHLEAGYAVGKGKYLIIYQQTFPKGEFDVMYGFADLITDDFKTVMAYLKKKDSDSRADKAFNRLAESFF